MNTTLVYFSLGLSVVSAIAAAIIAWKVANFFLARREFYVKSPYEILMKKLGWCIFWFLFTLTIGIKIVTPDKDKTPNTKTECTNDKHK